jgi:hypothetical protein
MRKSGYKEKQTIRRAVNFLVAPSCEAADTCGTEMAFAKAGAQAMAFNAHPDILKKLSRASDRPNAQHKILQKRGKEDCAMK